MTASEISALYTTGTVTSPAPAVAVQATGTLLQFADTPVSTAVSATLSSGSAGVWSLVSGPGTASFANATSATTTASFSGTGTYVLRFTGTANGQTNYSDVAVTVTGYLSNVVNAGSSITFSTGGATNYAWTVDSGTVASAVPSYTYSPQNFDVGTHLISVLKTYASGSTSRLNWQVRVAIPLPPPAYAFYVATNGNDANSGSMASPFQTLEQARNAIRALPRPLPPGGAAVYLRSGTYWRTNTFFLTGSDSGTPEAPIVYSSYPGEQAVISTGTALLSSQWAPLDPGQVSRVAPGVNSSMIWEADASGFINHGPLPASGGASQIRCVLPGADTGSASLPDVFYNNARVWNSRYPNHVTPDYNTPTLYMNGIVLDITGSNYLNGQGTYFTSGSVAVNVGGAFYYAAADSSHVTRWATAIANGGLWLQSASRVEWQTNLMQVMGIDTGNKVIELAPNATPQGGIGNDFASPPTGYTGRPGTNQDPYCVINLLEEMDQAGEWAVDFNRNKLYFFMDKAGAPPDNSVVVADNTVPVAQIDAANVVLKSLVFDECMGLGVSIPTGVGNLIVGCTFTNMSNAAVYIPGSTQNGVVSCDFSNFAAMGIQINGTGSAISGANVTVSGSIVSLSGSTLQIPYAPSLQNYIVNDSFVSLGRYNRMYQPGVWLGNPASGNRLAHLYMYDIPHMGVVPGGFHNIYEFNDISLYGTAVNDNGGYYCYQAYYGDDSYLYNFTHDTPTASSITFDGGNVRIVTAHFYGNISLQGSACEGQSIGVGLCSQLDCVNNISIGGGRYGSFDFTSGSLQQVYSGTQQSAAGNPLLATPLPLNINNNVSVDCYYPPAFNWSLVTVSNGTNNYSNTTASVLSNNPSSNIELSNDPGFLNMASEDLRMLPNASLFQTLPTFNPIPFEMIGMYNDEYRSDGKVMAPYVAAAVGAFVSNTTALLTGTLYYPQFDLNTQVAIYYGSVDSGTNTAGWTGQVNLGTLQSGSFSTLLPVTGTNQPVFYRILATNPGGSSWSGVTGAFLVRTARAERSHCHPERTRAGAGLLDRPSQRDHLQRETLALFRRALHDDLKRHRHLFQRFRAVRDHALLLCRQCGERPGREAELAAEHHHAGDAGSGFDAAPSGRFQSVYPRFQQQQPRASVERRRLRHELRFPDHVQPATVVDRRRHVRQRCRYRLVREWIDRGVAANVQRHRSPLQPSEHPHGLCGDERRELRPGRRQRLRLPPRQPV